MNRLPAVMVVQLASYVSVEEWLAMGMVNKFLKHTLKTPGAQQLWSGLDARTDAQALSVPNHIPRIQDILGPQLIKRLREGCRTLPDYNDNPVTGVFRNMRREFTRVELFVEIERQLREVSMYIDSVNQSVASVTKPDEKKDIVVGEIAADKKEDNSNKNVHTYEWLGQLPNQSLVLMGPCVHEKWPVPVPSKSLQTFMATTLDTTDWCSKSFLVPIRTPEAVRAVRQIWHKQLDIIWMELEVMSANTNVSDLDNQLNSLTMFIGRRATRLEGIVLAALLFLSMLVWSLALMPVRLYMEGHEWRWSLTLLPPMMITSLLWFSVCSWCWSEWSNVFLKTGLFPQYRQWKVNAQLVHRKSELADFVLNELFHVESHKHTERDKLTVVSQNEKYPYLTVNKVTPHPSVPSFTDAVIKSKAVARILTLIWATGLEVGLWLLVLQFDNDVVGFIIPLVIIAILLTISWLWCFNIPNEYEWRFEWKLSDSAPCILNGLGAILAVLCIVKLELANVPWTVVCIPLYLMMIIMETVLYKMINGLRRAWMAVLCFMCWDVFIVLLMAQMDGKIHSKNSRVWLPFWISMAPGFLTLFYQC